MKRVIRAGIRGFTLLEILVAISIMAIAVTLVLQLFSVNLRAVSFAGVMSSAAIRGEDRLRDILAAPSLTESSWVEVSEDGHRLDVSIVEVLKERTDNLPVKLMEVSLTIHWMEGQKERILILKSQKIADKIMPAMQTSAAQD
jgi:prepilin-type N-terminal cleavage/methylation domain-containing protein